MTGDTYHSGHISGSSPRFQSNNANSSSARSSLSLMSIPNDEEKWIPSPVPKLPTVRTFFGGSLRKRRTLATGIVLLAVMGLAGWSWYRGRLPVMGDFWNNESVGKSMSYLVSRLGLTCRNTSLLLGPQ